MISIYSVFITVSTYYTTTPKETKVIHFWCLNGQYTYYQFTHELIELLHQNNIMSQLYNIKVSSNFYIIFCLQVSVATFLSFTRIIESVEEVAKYKWNK